MASYTSTQNGNWNDPATWGGSGYPSASGDTATINHTVTYNVSSATELGDITINNGGILTFATNMNTKLTLGNASITVKSGGELRVGSSTNPIPKNYKAELVWNTTSDNSKGITVESGGLVNIYGDPDYYGSSEETVLASDWTSGQTFTIIGDFTNKWNVGDEITVHRGQLYSDYNTDVRLFTIASISLNGSNTNITINEAAPGVTFKAGGKVINVSRNVILTKYNASKTIGNYNSNRPRILVSSDNALSIKHAQITGFYSVNFSFYSGTIEGVVIRNSDRGIESVKDSQITLTVYSCRCGVYYPISSTVYGNIYANFYGFFGGLLIACYASVFSNYYCFYLGGQFKIYSSVYSNRWAFFGTQMFIVDSTARVFYNYGGAYGSIHVLFYGKFGEDENGNQKSNTYDIHFGAEFPTIIYLFGNVKSGDFNFYGRNSRFVGEVYWEDSNGIPGEHRVFHAHADIIKDTTVVRPNGASASLKITPLSNCSTAWPVILWNNGLEPFAKVWLKAGEQRTIKVYVKSAGAWTTYPTADELGIEVSYYSSPSSCERSTVTSTEVLTDDSTWTPLTVTITPQHDGLAYINVFLKKYESGKGVYIDPKVEVV